MLRIIETFNHLPTSYKVDIDAKFGPGQIGSLKIKDNQTVVSVCDGINPIGILDDIKNKFIRRVRYQQRIIISPGVKELKYDLFYRLEDKNIISKSFISTINVVLDPKKGIITIPKNTQIYNDCIDFVVNYAFNLKSDDDSTVGSGRATVWGNLLIIETDMFDTTTNYHKYDNLYSNNGLFTNIKPTYESKYIGFVLNSPSNDNPVLKLFFDLNNKIEIGLAARR